MENRMGSLQLHSCDHDRMVRMVRMVMVTCIYRSSRKGIEDATCPGTQAAPQA